MMDKKTSPNMSMQETCGCSPDEILIYPCAGGSNVGQLSNAAGVKLTESKVGKLFCLAAIGGHVTIMIESARAAKRVVAIDGCGVACSKKTLEHAGFGVTDHVVITELGMKKSKNFALESQDIERVSSAVVNSLLQKAE